MNGQDAADTNAGLPPEGTGDSITTTVTARVKAGHEPFYERFLEGIIEEARRFPGHIGVEVFRPRSAAAGEYRVVYRFDTRDHLQAWLNSAERAAWLERAAPHVIGSPRTQFITGLESWFTLPGQSITSAPPPYKMALLTWASIFPLITLVVIVLGPVLKELDLVPSLALTTAVTVPVMTWVAMPLLTRLLRRWLYPDRERRARRFRQKETQRTRSE